MDTTRVLCNNGAILNVDAKEPLYLGDVHTIPLQIEKRLVEGSARVQTSGTFVLHLARGERLG